MIELKELHIGYSHGLLQPITMKLELQKVYLLLGKNGAGKSTLLKTITNQLKPISGSCFINDTDLLEIDLKDLPKTLSFVSPKLEATDFVTVFDYVAIGRSPYTNLLGALHPLDVVKIKNALDTVGLRDLENRYLEELSDGERQLCALAKAIAQETDIIVLDEPTAFLDYTNKRKVITLLNQISSEFNKCIIASIHDVDLAIESNNEIIAIDKELNTLRSLGNSISKEKLIQIAY